MRGCPLLNVTDSAGAPTETNLPDYAAVTALGPDLNADQEVFRWGLWALCLTARVFGFAHFAR